MTPRERTFLATAVSLVAFAGNSLLARAALVEELADPVAFTALRLTSGAVALGLLVGVPRRVRVIELASTGSWGSATALFGYAIGFSWAYLSLSAGTGALVLFAAVQGTMVGAGLAGGERPTPIAWLGVFLALGGLVHLTLPGLEAPDPLGILAMAAAGVCWGVYSLRGRKTRSPALATTGNFLKAAPFALGLAVAALAASSLTITPVGVTLALVSGAITSGLGYVVWYSALRGLAATSAAIVQLLVPVLAALGGVVLLGERATLRLVVAGLLILGGVGLATFGGDGRRRDQ